MPFVQQVLVVDDEPSMAELVGGMLPAPHYSTTTVRSGEAALRFLSSRVGLVTIVIVDLRLRGMSGRRLAEVIAADFHEAAVLFMSDPPFDVGEPLPSPLMPKPLRKEQLVLAIQQLVARHRRRYLLSADHFGHVRMAFEAIARHDRLVRTHANRVHDLLQAWHPYPAHGI